MTKAKRSTLPSGAATPIATATLPGAEGLAAQPAPDSAADGPPRSRAERIRASTLAGGLESVPAGFDDADGDWQTVAAESLFERLYLDGEAAAGATPAMARGNYAVLQQFWSDKIAAMQTGAAKSQLLIKYGGSLRSEELIRSYPRELKKAADRLGAPNGIDDYRAELNGRRRASALASVAPLLELILSNESLEPAETEAFFNHALNFRFTLSEAAELLHETITLREFHSVETPAGETLAEQLRSVQWVSPRRAVVPEAPSEPAGIAIPPPASAPPPATPRSPTFAFPRTALVLLVGATAIVCLRLLVAYPPSASPPANDTALPSKAAIATPVSTTTTAHHTRTTPRPQDETREGAPQTDTAAEQLKKLQRETAQRERQRVDAVQRDEAARAEQETARIAKLRVDLAAAAEKAGALLDGGDAEAAKTLLDDSRASTAADATALAAELSEVERLRQRADTAVVHAAVLRSRIETIDQLNDDKKYPEAMSMVTLLLREPSLSGEMKERAERAMAVAQDALQQKSKDSDRKIMRLWRRKKGTTP